MAPKNSVGLVTRNNLFVYLIHKKNTSSIVYHAYTPGYDVHVLINGDLEGLEYICTLKGQGQGSYVPIKLGQGHILRSRSYNEVKVRSRSCVNEVRVTCEQGQRSKVKGHRVSNCGSWSELGIVGQGYESRSRSSQVMRVKQSRSRSSQGHLRQGHLVSYVLSVA